MIDIIKAEVERALPKAIELRHKIHRSPELSFEEFETSKTVCGLLEELGIEYKAGIAGTGVLGIIRGEKHCGGKSKTVLIRGDMDALPVCENSGVGFASEKRGVMHACGHDMHTSVLLCCAMVLSRMRDKFSGCVKLMFQPGEETSGGAKPMIDLGVLKNPHVDSCVALHVEPSLNVGQARFKAGAAYACPDEFYIKIKGRGGHAAAPHESIDPILIASQVVCTLQTIVSRIANPLNPMVVSVCSIKGGEAYNVIPDEVEFKGTARSFSNEDRNMLEEKIELAVKQACEMYGADYEYKFDRLFPPLINNEKTIMSLKSSAEKYLASENVIYGGDLTMAGEDFSYLTEEVEESALFWLGSTPIGAEKHPLHSDKLVVDDECLKYGTEIFVDYVLNYLND